MPNATNALHVRAESLAVDDEELELGESGGMPIATQRRMSNLRRILVPVDGSPPSIAALEHAIALAEDTGAMVESLHIDAPNEFDVGSSSPSTPDARQQSLHEMDMAIDRARSRLGDHFTWRTEEGDPLRRIIEVAGEGDFDLIVMGTHGRVGRLYSLLGSVAEGIVRSAPCPVLTVREGGGEYQSFAERIHGTPSLAEQAEQATHHR
jgi:nucleotide-binding universal stress UspA family protein